MNTNAIYFNQLAKAIDSLSPFVLDKALVKIQSHYLNIQIQQQIVRASDSKRAGVARLFTSGLVDVRGEQDLTPLMYVCALYYVAHNNPARRKALDAMAETLIIAGAAPYIEGARPIIRSVNTKGVPVYSRGKGKTLAEAFGHANLPPSLQARMAITNEAGYYDMIQIDRWNERQIAA